MNDTSQNQTELKFDKHFKIPKKADNGGDNLTEGGRAPEDITRGLNIPQGDPLPSQNCLGTFVYQPDSQAYPKPEYTNLPQFEIDYYNNYAAHYQPNNQNVLAIFQQNLLKRHREVPKNTGKSGKYADTYPHNSDPTLPKQLTEQFQPLYCKLCNAQLSSNSMAKLHYKSKNHEKKIRRFLMDYSERTGEPLHPKACTTTGSKRQKLGDDNNPKYFHCEVCDLPLTGRQHAESHYMGKNHQKVMAGKAPAGKGHYDDEGKWVRTTNPNGSDDDTLPTEFLSAKDIRARELYCELCRINVTSHQQMVIHCSGQKHKKRLQQQTIAGTSNESNAQGDPQDNILSTLSYNVIQTGDLSVYRTPTGFYYCNPCNLTLNSETQFKQHLGSKKHRKKASTSKD